MSHRREAKQRVCCIMEKRRKTDQVAAQIIHERNERRLAIIEDIKQKIAMIEEQESAQQLMLPKKFSKGRRLYNLTE